jgi:hypothetical protein
MIQRKEYRWLSALVLCFLFCAVVMPVYGRPQLVIPKSELQGKNGQELLEILRKWHTEAYRTDAELIYPESMVLDIEVPAEAKGLPLPPCTNFNGCKIIIENQSINNFILFSLSNKKSERQVKVNCSMINSGDYTSLPQLKSGLKLMRIRDRNAWTHRAPEEGDYDIFRQDIVLIKDGVALNMPITGYDEETSNPDCRCIDVDDEQKVICNLTFERSDNSTLRTRLLHITLQNNVLVKNVKISTPYVPQETNNSLYREDYCIRVMNSVNVYFEDVMVRGTYSTAKTWGYAVNLENVYNSHFLRFDAEAHWGVFGNNNVNTITLTDCRINRFDLHCYGRDVTCRGCVFNNQIDDSHPSQVYCQTNVLNAFGSMYGTPRYEDCHFVKSRPVYLRPHYMAYTGFDVVFEDCVFDIHPSFPYFVTTGLLDEADNPRKELKGKCWPNVSMQNCQVNVPARVKDLFIFYAQKNSKTISKIDNLSSLDLQNVDINNPSFSLSSFKVSNVEIKLANRLKTKTKRTSFRLKTDMLRKR